ncbi:MAG TPA: sulfite exporter TauE/SafE family protein, partial [bacterium]
WDDATRTWSPWQPRRLVTGLVLFAGVGAIGGLFGLGAGWANIPVLNLVMGVPLKSAVATSYFLLAASGSTAAWVYLHHGALLPLIVIPAVLGVMLGARLGARLLLRTPANVVRWLVIVVLVVSGIRAVLRGAMP